MSLDTTVPRSRRALLAAALGVGVATVANALGRPTPVRANDPNDVVLGTYNWAPTRTVIASDADDGVAGSSSGSNMSGVYGVNSNADGYGVFGRNQSHEATGYLGGPDVGAHGGGSFAGVTGESSGWGVIGSSESGGGVFGMSGQVAWVVEPANAGVWGVAENNAASVGVYGYSSGGTGGRFGTSTGTALQVVGKAKFDRAGKVTIKKGSVQYKKTLAGVTGSSQAFAVLRTHRSGTYVVAVVCGTGYFTIHLNRALLSDTGCSYFVVN
jgi:hypothetical protein